MATTANELKWRDWKTMRCRKILEKIAAARSEGDLSENAEYHAQREAQGLLQARINKLKSDLARATIVDPSKLPTDQVAFGATVVVRDLDLDDEEEFTLVGAGDEDYDAGKYLDHQPDRTRTARQEGGR